MRMLRQRRYEQFLSFLLLAAGISLLTYVGAAWFLSQQEPDVISHAPPEDSNLLDLPPALAAAPQMDEQSLVPAPPLKGQLFDAPLLPQSPLAEEQEASAPGEAAAVADSGPLRIIIPALGIDAPVRVAELETKQDGGRTYQQWSVPNGYAAGWHDSSAALGQAGNTVLNGHNNVHGAIFAELAELAVGEQIILAGDEELVVYRVAHHELLEERGVSLRQRLYNARWIAPTEDERLTLVTCWPNTTNSHRLIIVAEPAGKPFAEAAAPAIN